MTLKEKQIIFCRNVTKLIDFAFSLTGYALTIGECQRTPEQQLLYFEGYTIQKIGSNLHFIKSSRKTKTLQSKHLEKLAIDLNLFIDGVYQTEKEPFKKLAEFWKSLHPSNVSGYDWNYDFNHFQMS